MESSIYSAPTRTQSSLGNDSDADAPRPNSPPLAADYDAPLLAILDAPLMPGETAHAGYRRKEHVFGAALAALSILDALSLHRRLSSPRPADALATRFARLTNDRQQRLLAFLADARRRAALGGHR